MAVINGQHLETNEIRRRFDRFNERVDEAQRRCPASKEWVRAAVTHKGAPRCPVFLRRLSYDIIATYGDRLADLFVEYPDDIVLEAPYDPFIGYQPPDREPHLDAVRILTEAAEWTDEWGTRWGHASGGVGASPLEYPIGDWSQLDDYLAHRMPDPAATGRFDAVQPSLAAQGSDRFFVGLTNFALFERLHCLHGMERTFEDLYVHPREVGRLLDALTDFYIEIIRGWARLPGVDAILATDDWGSQRGLMISREMWRSVFSPRYRRMWDEAHRCGLMVVFHSCGNITGLIGDLIDVGANIIEPLQPEAMDLRSVAREFGGKVAFEGGLSDQVLSTHSPQQVRDEVLRAIDALGAPYGNAYIPAPSNTLMPEVPFDNLIALFETCHNQ